MSALAWVAIWLCGCLVLLAAPTRPRSVGARRAHLRIRASQVGYAIAAGVMAALFTRSLLVAASSMAVASAVPGQLARRRRGRIERARLGCWPDAIDALASAVRAGLSLPEALADLGRRGPEPLRVPFTEYSLDLATSGNFGRTLDKLKERLADPVADRVIESIRVAREVGGNDLGRLLRALSISIREDSRLRAEVASRQSWTVNAARLAVVAPWLTVAILGLRPQAVAAYASVGGLAVLTGAAVTCVVAYRLMIRIGRLPQERRVLR